MLNVPLARAETSPCESVYRAVYSDGWPWQNEAKEIYKIHFDALNQIDDAFTEAHKIFKALETPPKDQPGILRQMNWFMRTGQLCHANGTPMNFAEVIEILRSKR